MRILFFINFFFRSILKVCGPGEYIYITSLVKSQVANII